MKAIIWKEWRETLPWAVFALLGLLAAAWYFGYQAHIQQWLMVESLFDKWPALGGPLLAGALGMLQIMKEQRRDQWAFLVHRPETRTALLLGKMIAGLTLYYAVTLTAVLACGWWLATPGHLPAPFHPDILLAPTADFIAGSLFYFAGMLTALSTARWYGSKTLAFIVALLGAFLAYSAYEFSHAILWTLLFALPLALAAWGAFLRPGEYDTQPTAARFSRALVLLVACEVILMAALKPLWNPHDIQPAKLETVYRLTKKGDVLRVTMRNETWTTSQVLAATNIHGAPVPPPNGKTWTNDDFAPLLQMGESIFTPYRWPTRLYLRMDSQHATSTDEIWYYEKATGRLLGYTKSRRAPLSARSLPPVSLPPARPYPTGLALKISTGDAATTGRTS